MTPVRHLSAGAMFVAAFLLLVLAAPVSAAPTAHWTMISQPAPTEFHPGDTHDFYEVLAVNDGAADTSGEITVTDTLPAGITVNQASAYAEIPGSQEIENTGIGCEPETAAEVVTVTCTTEAGVPIGRSVLVNINVSVPLDAEGSLENEATITGGSASEGAATSNSTPVTPASQPVPYGSSLIGDLTDFSGALGTEAGSHPFSFTTLLDFNVGGVNPNEVCNQGTTPSCAALNTQARDVEVALPPGLVGNPTAIPPCTQAQFEQNTFLGCPASTQVGAIYLYFYGGGSALQYAPVYNIETPPGQPGELGFSVSTSAHIPIFFHLRSDGDYGLSADVSEIDQFDPVRISALSIWGVPSDEAHNPLRRSVFGGCGNGSGGCPSGVLDPKPFLTLPTDCSGVALPLSTSGDSWQNPLAPPFPLLSATTLAAMSACNQLKFEPTLEARPTTNVADSPSGLHVDLHVPQPEVIGGKAEAHLKDATVTLPKGLTVNPASAAGREGCTPEQIGLTSAEGATPIRTTAAPANCPDTAKIGKVEVKTPLLKDPLLGSVYLATPYANPFKSLLAIYITVDDPKTNTVVKLAGHVEIGADGQLTTTVTESPQVPFTEFKLDFFNGARAPLRTPAVCGTYETTSELTPWSAPESGPPAKRSDSYQIEFGPNGHACPHTEAAEPHSPGFKAGTVSPLAGTYSPFVLHLNREDGSQNFSALNVTLPPGLIGKLAGVGECPDSALVAAAGMTGAQEQAAPSCPLGSRLGTVNVGAGAGPSPYYAQGTAYLTGPYKGAPLSIAVITPALAGPFDLGTVIVRNALYVNSETAQISVKSDPIPTQLQGIQLDVRSIDLAIDRDQFTLNPTSCGRMAFSGEAVSSLGQVAPLASPFQVGECGRLPFKPKLAIKLKGAVHRRAHPKLIATLTAKPGEANIARSVVKLPTAAFLDNAHIGTICTRVQFAADQCPPASVYGEASATTPLLDQPLTGPVYLRSSSHKLPDLVVDLQGPTTQPIEIALAGKTDSVKGALRNTFEAAPDAPIKSFRLELFGGKRGLIEMSSGFCAHPKASVSFTGHNGKVSDTNPVVASSCKTKGRKGERR